MNILITNVFGSTNKGDALLLESLIDNLYHTYGERISKIYGIAQFPEIEAEHFPDIQWFQSPARSRIKNRFLRRLHNCLLITRTSLFYFIGRMLNVKKVGISDVDGLLQMAKVDLIVASGGGYLLDINASFYNNLLQIFLASTFKIPLILAPQTYGPISHSLNKKLFRYVISRVDYICAREDISMEFLESLSLESSKTIRCEDLAFDYPNINTKLSINTLDDVSSPAQFCGESYICITFVDWYYPRFNRELMQDRYIKEMQLIIHKILEHTSYKLYVVNQVSSDIPIAEKILSAFDTDRIFLDRSNLETREVMQIISHSSALIGSRFHSCVFALLSQTPLISSAYTHKSTGIMKTLGLYEYVFDINTFVASDIFEKLNFVLATKDEFKQRLHLGIKENQSTKFTDVLQKLEI